MWAKIDFKVSNFNSETLSMIKYVVNHFRNFSGLELNYRGIKRNSRLSNRNSALNF